jgi:hypothetical protein
VDVAGCETDSLISTAVVDIEIISDDDCSFGEGDVVYDTM